MEKDKYGFIQDLLNNQKLSTAQRERIFLLTSEELKKDKINGKLLEGRVIRLEEMVGIKADNELDQFIDEEFDINNSIKNDKASKSDLMPKQYYYPSGLYKYLLAYNQDPILKSTCHLVDSNELEKIKMYC
jgi:hypothetical protein